MLTLVPNMPKTELTPENLPRCLRGRVIFKDGCHYWVEVRMGRLFLYVDFDGDTRDLGDGLVYNKVTGVLYYRGGKPCGHKHPVHGYMSFELNNKKHQQHVFIMKRLGVCMPVVDHVAQSGCKSNALHNLRGATMCGNMLASAGFRKDSNFSKSSGSHQFAFRRLNGARFRGGITEVHRAKRDAINLKSEIADLVGGYLDLQSEIDKEFGPRRPLTVVERTFDRGAAERAWGWKPFTLSSPPGRKTGHPDIDAYGGMFRLCHEGRLWRFFVPKLGWTEIVPSPCHANGFAKAGLNNKKLYIHHIVISITQGYNMDPEITVDHIDRDPTNNHPDNLRWATKVEQRANQKRKKSASR